MVRNYREHIAQQARLARDRFLANLQGDRPREAQEAVLAQCVNPNADTAFGRQHGFLSIRDPDSYRAAVPIREYEGLAPWIERAASGEPAVLTREPVSRFWKTTGTSTTPKKIPTTRSANLRVADSWLVVQGTQLAYYPDAFDRADAMLTAHISPKAETERTPGGHRYCSTTEAPIEIKPQHVEHVAPWLPDLQSIVEDDAERLYYLLAYASLHDLRAISCLHPSRYQTIVRVLDGSWQRIAKELRDGTLCGRKMREPRPDRAIEIEAMVARQGTLLPRDLWPDLRFLTSWSGSYIGRYRPLMERAFCDGFLMTPSVASECFMTMTIDEDRLGQPINVRGGFLEFVPSGDAVEEGSPTLLADELSDGALYEIVLTTLGGLYRYAIGDIFRVTGFADRVPRLEYVGRRAVSDLTGEKLAEAQAMEVIRAALDRHDMPTVQFTLCAVHEDGTGRCPRYVLVLEPPQRWTAGHTERLARDIDADLKRANSRYELKRNFKDLDSLEVVCVPPGTFAAYRSLLARRGTPAGQIKDRPLHPVGAPVLADLVELAQGIRS